MLACKEINMSGKCDRHEKTKNRRWCDIGGRSPRDMTKYSLKSETIIEIIPDRYCECFEFHLQKVLIDRNQRACILHIKGELTCMDKKKMKHFTSASMSVQRANQGSRKLKLFSFQPGRNSVSRCKDHGADLRQLHSTICSSSHKPLISFSMHQLSTPKFSYA